MRALRFDALRLRAGVASLAALTVFTAGIAAGAESGLQLTPDGKRTLISKDVQNQRWAITYDRADGTVTGNVFSQSDGAVTFVWCEIADDGSSSRAEVALSCYGAKACSAAPCTSDQWGFIADVTLARSFFEPPPGDDPSVVPTSSAALFAWLQAGRYGGFAAESDVHPSAGPHGGAVRTFVNDVLESSLAAGNASHPAGAAAVKELYGADRSTLTGWAVEVKVQDASAGGQGWYWYEVFSTTDGSSPIEGLGNAVCTGCHAQGDDYVRIPFPLQ